jgi:hypothetical protein
MEAREYLYILQKGNAITKFENTWIFLQDVFDNRKAFSLYREENAETTFK